MAGNGLLVVDYQNLAFLAGRSGSYVDLHALAKAADEVSETLVEERTLFLSNIFLSGLYGYERDDLEQQMVRSGFSLKIVPVPLELRNREKRAQRPEGGSVWFLQDPVDQAIIDHCREEKEYITTLVLATNDGGFAGLVREFGGYLIHYNQPSYNLVRVARASIEVKPAKNKKRLADVS